MVQLRSSVRKCFGQNLLTSLRWSVSALHMMRIFLGKHIIVYETLTAVSAVVSSFLNRFER
jgi:hypothetical protein